MSGMSSPMCGGCGFEQRGKVWRGRASRARAGGLGRSLRSYGKDLKAERMAISEVVQIVFMVGEL